MTILTATEAQNILRLDSSHAVVTMLLPAIDSSIELATGRNWAADSSIEPLAKVAAQLLLVPWFENPGMMGDTSISGPGYDYVIGQLQAKALILKSAGIPDAELALMASAPEDGELTAAVSVRPLLVFNHAMASASGISVQTAAGAAVSVTCALDVTSKRVTVTPAASLSAATDYEIVLTAAADIYGQTLTETVRFRTAG